MARDTSTSGHRIFVPLDDLAHAAARACGVEGDPANQQTIHDVLTVAVYQRTTALLDVIGGLLQPLGELWGDRLQDGQLAVTLEETAIDAALAAVTQARRDLERERVAYATARVAATETAQRAADTLPPDARLTPQQALESEMPSLLVRLEKQTGIVAGLQIVAILHRVYDDDTCSATLSAVGHAHMPGDFIRHILESGLVIESESVAERRELSRREAEGH